MPDITAIKAGRGLTERAACLRLARLAESVPADQVIVELGAYCGRTTAWIALGAMRGCGARVVSVDPWDLRPDIPAYAISQLESGYRRGDYASAFDTYRQHLLDCGVSGQVDTIRGYGTQTGESWEGPKVGLLWHDADHSPEAIESDLNAWLPHLARRCTVALHDACQEGMGVIEGAERVLNAPGWNWPGRIHKWKKDPTRRGMLVVKR